MSISLCIPTLNEERTIGKEIVVLKSELMDRHRLLDEIAVIDSGSDDATREVARAFGADVYPAAEILPKCGHHRGKGENLWKAIYQLSGDIIVYVDADIRNIHPRFVYGLVGPLLSMPEVSYVKAFYDRPLAESGRLRPSGGGRVTEILIRPAVLPVLSRAVRADPTAVGGVRGAARGAGADSRFRSATAWRPHTSSTCTTAGAWAPSPRPTWTGASTPTSPPMRSGGWRSASCRPSCNGSTRWKSLATCRP